MMELIEVFLVPLTSALIGGIIVALANHYLGKRRDRDRTLSQKRVILLMDAWGKISAASNIENWDGRDQNKLFDDYEGAFASILLLGSEKEIEIAKAAAETGITIDLLKELRKSLRRELGLKEFNEKYFNLKMARENNS